MEQKEQHIQDNILFLGNRNDVYRLYQAMDVFVLPSRYEGLPVVGVEAQAAGLPCVLSDKITEETKMKENVIFLNIDDGAKVWSKLVLDEGKMERNDSEENGEELINSGFFINERALSLEQYYLKNIKSVID